MFLDKQRKVGVCMYNAISFFSNAGIGDIGVETAGVSVVYANELLEKRADTYKLNHPHTYVKSGDINELKEEDFSKMKSLYGEELFLFVATPPCQGVSSAGKRDKFDVRNQLIKPTIRAIQKTLPLWVWLENVPGYQFATIPDTLDVVEDDDTYDRISITDFIEKYLAPFGYKVAFKVLDAKDYGTPQTRKRMITILTRTDKEITFPEATHGTPENPFNSVRNAISHLPSLQSGERCENDSYHFGPKHNVNHIRWMAATPEGQTAFDNVNFDDRPHTTDKITGEKRLIKAFRTTYKRIWWDKPSPTVTMYSGGISSQNNVHPADARALSVREAMLLQSMPNTYQFPEGTKEKEMREMIGEAVPCLLSKAITQHIIKLHEAN